MPHTRPTLRLPHLIIAYLLFGFVWLLLSAYLFRQLSESPRVLLQLELASASGLLVLSGALLYLLLNRRWLTTGAPATERRSPAIRGLNKRLAATLALPFLAVPCIMFTTVWLELPWLKQDTFKQLSAIAQLKSGQIESWLAERYADGQTVISDPGYRELLRSNGAGSDDSAVKSLHQRLETFRQAFRYRSIALISRDGRFMLQASMAGEPAASLYGMSLDAIVSDYAIGESSPTLHIHNTAGGAHLGIALPIPGDSQHAPSQGVLLIHIGPESFLSPYTADWPTSSGSGETLLADVSEQSVVYLTPQRRTALAAGTPTLPRETPQLQNVLAQQRGGSGTFEGSDYRGAPVLAAYHPVAGTNWHLIAKQDLRETVEPLITLTAWVGIISLIAAVLLALLLLRLWRQQEQIAHHASTDERLRSDSLIQQFFDLPFIGIAFTSPQTGEWLRFNDRLCELLGYSRDELEALDWVALTHPDDLEVGKEQYRKLLSGEVAGYSRDKRFIRKDGSVLEAFLDIKCIRDKHGEVEYLVAMIQDIGERKQFENRLERERLKARNYLDIAGALLISLDSSGRLQLVNRRACELLGRTEEELLGSNWFEQAIPERLRPEVSDVFRRLIAGETEFVEYYENPIVSCNGEERLIRWRSTLVCDTDGRPSEILSSGEDITELRNSEVRLRTLFNTIPDLIWLKDSEGIYLACNPMVERYLGVSEAEIIGKTDYDFVDRELADFFRENDRKAMTAGKPSINEEHLTFASDGFEGTFETIKTPVSDSEGKLIGVLGISRNITLRKQAIAHQEYISRLYATLSHTNQSIVRSKNAAQLYRDTCRSAVVHGGFKMVWIGTFTPASPLPEPKASYSKEQDAARFIEHALASDSPYGLGPIGSALRQKQPYWCQDLLHDPNTRPWHEAAQQAGFLAFASLPIELHGEVVATLNLYADQVGAFDQEVRRLLVEMTSDISFVLESFDRDERRREAEQRLSLVIRGTNDAPWDWDLLRHDFWYSPQWWKLLGYAAEDLQTSEALWRTLAHPDDIAMVDAMFTGLRQPGKELDSVECRFRHKSGHYIPTLIRAIASRNEQQQTTRIAGTVMDLSERKRIEQALRDQRDEYLRARRILDSHLENSPVGVIEWDPDFRIIRWSRRAEEIFGWPEQEVLHKRPDEFPLIFDDDAVQVEKVITDLVSGKAETSHIKNRNYTREGKVVHTEWFSSALRDEEGTLLSILSFVLDITEQQRAATELRQRENLLQKIFDTLPIGLWYANRQGEVVQSNPAGHMIWGGDPHVTPESYSLFKAWRKPSGEPLGAEDWALYHTIRDGITVRDELLEIETFDGQRKTILNYSSPVMDEHGEVEGAIVVNLDITERQRAIEERKLLSDALRQSAVAMVMLNPELRFEFINHAFSELFGYSQDELLGRPVSAIAPYAGTPTLFPEQVITHTRRFNTFRGEVVRSSKSGEQIPIYLTVSPLLNDAKSITGYVASFSDMRAIKESRKRLQEALTDTIIAISHTIEKRDPYTAGHQQRVAELAAAIARELQLEPARIEGIYLGSLIHDIGKIYIPSEILNRPGKLTGYEFGLIKSHPEVGHEIIKDVKFEWPIAEMVYQHHERLDGSGYPNGLKGDEICLEAKIIATADTVEAITSHRPYRPGLGLDHALAEIESQAGVQLDREIVTCCIRLFREKGFVWSSSQSELGSR